MQFVLVFSIPFSFVRVEARLTGSAS